MNPSIKALLRFVEVERRGLVNKMWECFCNFGDLTPSVCPPPSERCPPSSSFWCAVEPCESGEEETMETLVAADSLLTMDCVDTLSLEQHYCKPPLHTHTALLMCSHTQRAPQPPTPQLSDVGVIWPLAVIFRHNALGCCSLPLNLFMSPCSPGLPAVTGRCHHYARCPGNRVSWGGGGSRWPVTVALVAQRQPRRYAAGQKEKWVVSLEISPHGTK